MSTNRLKLLFWRLTSFGGAITLLYLCLTPAPPQLHGPLGLDKLQHAGAFGLFTFLIFKVFRLQNIPLIRSCWFAVLSATFWGGLIELLQGCLTINRTADLLDFFADVIGSILVVLFLYLKSKARG